MAPVGHNLTTSSTTSPRDVRYLADVWNLRTAQGDRNASARRDAPETSR
jgi:hypothetical protein